MKCQGMAYMQWYTKLECTMKGVGEKGGQTAGSERQPEQNHAIKQTGNCVESHESWLAATVQQQQIVDSPLHQLNDRPLDGWHIHNSIAASLSPASLSMGMVVGPKVHRERVYPFWVEPTWLFQKWTSEESATAIATKMPRCSDTVPKSQSWLCCYLKCLNVKIFNLFYHWCIMENMCA